MSEKLTYQINKGVNRPIEFRGLKGQYIYILAIGLAVMLVSFSILYIAGTPVYLLVPVFVIAGFGLFTGVYRLSHRYGQHGLMKAMAARRVPSAILFSSRKVLTGLAKPVQTTTAKSSKGSVAGQIEAIQQSQV